MINVKPSWNLFIMQTSIQPSRPGFTYLKLTKEALKHGVKYSLLLTLNIFHTLF